MSISGNASTTTNLTHCFVAQGVKPSGQRHLDDTEDIEVVLLNKEDVFDLMEMVRHKQRQNGLIYQSGNT